MLGPMVVVAENSAADLLDVLGKAGAFPIVETGWADAPAAIAEIQPVALAIAEPGPAPDLRHKRALLQAIETRGGPVMPVIARVTPKSEVALPYALPVAVDDAPERLVARLRSALRIRTLHATVLRRARAEGAPAVALPLPYAPNILDDATVLCVGRGSSYPALSVAIGERVGLIGALSVETAARYLDGARHRRRRDRRRARSARGRGAADGAGRGRALPRPAGRRCSTIPASTTNGCPISSASTAIRPAWSSASCRWCACTRSKAHLKRTLKSLETEGVIDPETGLLGATRVLARSRPRGCGSRGWRPCAFGGALLVRGNGRPPRPASMRRGCSAGWSATSTSPAASRTARSSPPSPKPICAAPMWWRAASPASSGTPCCRPTATAARSSRP